MKIINWKKMNFYRFYFFAIEIQKLCSNYAYLRKAVPMFATYILCLLLTNCAQEIPRKFEVPAEVLPYVIEFQYQAYVHNVPLKIDDLVVEFKQDLHIENAVGLCYYGNSTYTPRIEIAAWWWNFASNTQKEILVYHELGHCILGRKHDKVLDIYGNPESIMYPSVLSAYHYEANKENLLKELFNGSNLYLY